MLWPEPGPKNLIASLGQTSRGHRIGNRASERQVLPLELLEAPRLLDLQAAVFLAPTVVRLF